MKLVEYPYVVLRIRCSACSHARNYRLARLALRCGPDADVERVLRDLIQHCPYARQQHERSRNQYKRFCLAYLPDLWDHTPPDMPPAAVGDRSVP